VLSGYLARQPLIIRCSTVCKVGLSTPN